MREHEPDAGQTVRHLDRLTGAILDQRYRIDQKLAAGGFGAIYRATDLVMGREVALKILHRALGSDPSVVERFRREAAALAVLRDQHTITMYDVGVTEDGTRYIVMELLRGESLYEQFQAHGRLSWRRVAAIARGVCSSLREAHGVGIVHRDLKPANIHLEKHSLQDDFVKVLDFGIAKMIEHDDGTNGGMPRRDLTLAGQMVGTFDYMPPEQMIGGRCTGRSDVFTLGVVMYEMITGHRPYGEAKGPASRLMTLLGTTPVSLATHVNVPAALDRIVMQTLQREPEDRLDIEELDAVLAKILDMKTDDDAEARFDGDDATWIDAAPHPMRATMIGAAPATPAHGSRKVTRPPRRSAAPEEPAAVIHDRPLRVTPVRGSFIQADPTSLPARPSRIALGSRAKLRPPPAGQRITPVGLPPPARTPARQPFVQGRPTPSETALPALPRMTRIDPPAATSARLAAGTSPIINETFDVATQDRARAMTRDAVIRNLVYVLLLCIVAATIFFMLR